MYIYIWFILFHIIAMSYEICEFHEFHPWIHTINGLPTLVTGLPLDYHVPWAQFQPKRCRLEEKDRRFSLKGLSPTGELTVPKLVP